MWPRAAGPRAGPARWPRPPGHRYWLAPLAALALAQLDEHAAQALGVNERDLGAIGAGARSLVDEPHAALPAARERSGQVVDLEADVVESRAARGEEFGDRV